ncbi:hypothetical protein SLEP1_g3205 [Rubroshorea leprosula]|uniref:Transposase MuDR plant domain-containing protein n=1 Tax=Rubroshorea leprosula TaxID=152421 RepID=A0AAV5HTA5_9ROSI|nr:hypothetical protein SLEP1_g3205 [Rubroshorea leprosula]
MDNYTRQKNPKEPEVVPAKAIDLESMETEDMICSFSRFTIVLQCLCCSLEYVKTGVGLVRCDKNGLDEVFTNAGGSRINEVEVGNNVGERNNGEEGEVQNDVRVQIDGCEEVEEAQYEGGLKDVLELSNNDVEEIVLARDNLRNFRANQLREFKMKMLEIQSDDEVSYISTSNEEDEEADHGRKRKARHKVFKAIDGILEIELSMIFLNRKQFKKAVDQLSIRQGREIARKKNDNKRMRVVCNDQSCK